MDMKPEEIEAHQWAIETIETIMATLKDIMCTPGEDTRIIAIAHWRRAALMEIIGNDTLTRNGVWDEVLNSPMMRPDIVDALTLETNDPDDVRNLFDEEGDSVWVI